MTGGTKLADAYVQIIPVSEGITNRIQSLFRNLPGEGDKAGGRTGEAFASKLKTTIAAAGIGTAVSKVMAGAFSEGAALEQSLGGVETLFKENADEIVEYANKAYKTAGVSANEYMQQVTSFSATLLQGLGGDTEKAVKYADMAMVDMSDNSNKFGSDMQSVQAAYQGFAKDNYTMLDNLKLGYGGTQTEMARLINDSGVLGDSIEVTADTVKDVPFDKVIEAIHVIQENLDITGTTSKEASSTFSGSFASMRAAAKNVLGVLTAGGDIDRAFDGLTDSAGDFAENFLRMAGTMGDQIKELTWDKFIGETSAAKTAIEMLAAAAGIFITVYKLTPILQSMRLMNVEHAIAAAKEFIKTKAVEATNFQLSTQASLALKAAGAIGAAVVVGNLLKSAIDKAAESIDVTESSIVDLSEGVKEFSDKCLDTKSSVEALHGEIADSYGDNRKQADSYRTLNDRLKELNDTENKSAGEKAEMQAIVDQLNGDIDGLNLTIDEQTGSLENNADAVSDMVSAYADMQDTKGLQDKLADATRNQADAQNAYDEALERYKKAKEDGMTGDDITALAESLINSRSALMTANDDLATVRKSIDDANEAQQRFADAYAETSGSMNRLSDETLGKVNEVCEKYAESYQTQHDLVFGQMDLLDEFCGKSNVTSEDLIKNLDENIEGFTGWENNLGKLKKKVAEGIISQDFYDNLEEMGPKGAGYANAFVNMTDEELKQYSVKSKGIFDEMNDYVDRSMSGMRDDSAQMLENLIDLPEENSYSMKAAYTMLGNYATEGYAEGIRSGSENMNEAVRQAIGDAVRTAMEAQDSHSPSKAFKKLGVYAGEGYALGIADETDLAVQASENMVRSAIRSANMVDDRIAVSAFRSHAAAQAFPDTANTGMRSAIMNALAEYTSVGSGRSTKQPLNVNVIMDKKVIGKAAVDDINNMTRLNGKSPLI